ncbi:hypothetical protein [Streptomyces xanthophaeus]|uniref:hypothetical protein n=1 Tax=Streptomyces xanthophaeus TaxID=67385 RepID=UPI00370FB436
MTEQPKAKGICPVCRREYTLTGTGIIRAHWARTSTGAAAPGLPDCEGTGTKPDPTP